MTVITRHDQAQFVLDVYREQVTVTKKTTLIRLLRSLQSTYGDYAHTHAVTAHLVDIVLAKQAGYLLAETIRQYFHANHNLIFCEWTSELNRLIVVIIQDGRIYCDRTLDPVCLAEELLPLRLSALNYQLVVAGHGISTNAPPDWVHAFTPLCSSQEYLGHSVIASLPLVEQALLTPIPQLLKSLTWRSQAPLWLGSALIAALIMSIGLFTYRERQPEPTPVSHAFHTIPWLPYQQAMQTQASASQVLSTTAQLLQALRGLSGWTLLNLQIHSTHLTANLQSTDGNLSELESLVHQFGARVQSTKEGSCLTLTFHADLPQRLPTLMPLATSQVRLQEALLRHTVDSQIQLLGIRRYDDCQVARLSVTLHDLYLAELISLAHLCHGQPITIEQFNLTLHDWQMHAIIKLSAWGTA